MDVTLNNSTIAQPVFACIQQKLWCQESFRTGIYTSAVAFITINVLTAVTAVLGNGLFFVAYYQNESLRKPANTILLSLAVTDFLTGAVSQPLVIGEKIVMLTNCTGLCTVIKLRSFSVAFLILATLCNLSLSALDRYVAVLHSFRYLDLVTNTRAQKASLALWLAVIITVSIIVFVLINISRPLISLIVAIVIFISILYYKIFKETRRLQADPIVAANEPEKARKAAERKAAGTVAIILGVLFLCYIPMIVYLIFHTTKHFILQIEETDNTRIFSQQLFYVAITFSLSNSAINIFVYYWKSTEIRSAMLKVVRPLTQRFVNEVNPA